MLVIIGHTIFHLPGPYKLLIYPLHDGHLGVATFFVISGFLITTILLKELNKTGSISLRKFYIRRSFRIFPPFYVYLGVIALLAANHIVQADRTDFINAATYTWNYRLNSNARILGHVWSLSLEEQFYLIWPAILILFGKRKSLWIAVGAVLLSPISRVATYFLAPAWRSHTGMMLHTRIDTIMIGCVLALVIDMKLWERFLAMINTTVTASLAAFFVLFVDLPISEHLKGNYSLPIGISLQGFCCGIIVLYTISHPHNLVGRFLNNRIIAHIGIISYSLYLWQQLFTANERFAWFPLNIGLIFLCAELSYFLVEKPSFTIRDKFLAMIWKQEDKRPIPVDAERLDTKVQN
jgi:peptidoglycan/LPS O-acetylase OafA/YrhL